MPIIRDVLFCLNVAPVLTISCHSAPGGTLTLKTLYGGYDEYELCFIFGGQAAIRQFCTCVFFLDRRLMTRESRKKCVQAI